MPLVCAIANTCIYTCTCAKHVKFIIHVYTYYIGWTPKETHNDKLLNDLGEDMVNIIKEV